MSPIDAINKAVKDLREHELVEIGPYKYFFEGGTGVPDGMLVEYFKDNPGIVVITGDGKKWRRGKEV